MTKYKSVEFEGETYVSSSVLSLVKDFKETVFDILEYSSSKEEALERIQRIVKMLPEEASQL